MNEQTIGGGKALYAPFVYELTDMSCFDPERGPHPVTERTKSRNLGEYRALRKVSRFGRSEICSGVR